MNDPMECSHPKYVDGQCTGCGRLSRRGAARREKQGKTRARMLGPSVYDELRLKAGFDSDGNMQ